MTVSRIAPVLCSVIGCSGSPATTATHDAATEPDDATVDKLIAEGWDYAILVALLHPEHHGRERHRACLDAALEDRDGPLYVQFPACIDPDDRHHVGLGAIDKGNDHVRGALTAVLNSQYATEGCTESEAPSPRGTL